MSLSSERLGPKNVRFVDVSSERRTPAWLHRKAEEPARVGPGERVDRLVPQEIPSHERPPLSPVLESVRPPAPRPSQYPSAPPGPASQYPGALEAGLEPFPAAGAEPRFDTQVEDLVPRAEEEAVQAISAAMERFGRERQAALAAAEGELVELVQAICRRVLLVELGQNPLLIERLVHTGLEALGGGDRITVKLGPFFADVAATIGENLEHKGVRALVLIDRSVGTHGCELSTDLGRVDEGVQTRLDVLLTSLGLLPKSDPPSSGQR